MLKKYKMLIELVNKIETENWAIDLIQSCKMMNDVAGVSKKFWFDCYVKWYPKEVIDYQPTGKTYIIKTVGDIVKLSPDQFEMFIEDLRNYCNLMRGIQPMIDLWIATSTEWMTWLDTGLHEEKLQVNISNKK